jgi:GH18 family chitinase
MEYVKNRGLAGAMFWEYSADQDKKLLSAVIDNLH